LPSRSDRKFGSSRTISARAVRIGGSKVGSRTPASPIDLNVDAAFALNSARSSRSSAAAFRPCTKLTAANTESTNPIQWMYCPRRYAAGGQELVDRNANRNSPTIIIVMTVGSAFSKRPPGRAKLCSRAIRKAAIRDLSLGFAAQWSIALEKASKEIRS